jgi:hypothetical protein
MGKVHSMLLVKRTFAIALSAIFTLGIVDVVQAHDSGSWKHKNRYLRVKVTKLHGKRAPGCNLVAHQCRGKKVNRKNVRRYFNTMRAMLMPKPAAKYVYAGKPYQPPAHTATVNAGGTLERIAQCESGGNPSTNTGNGFYGKYQFTMQTWQGVGGSGNPANASEAEQDKRAAILYSQSGASPWPVCGR